MDLQYASSENYSPSIMDSMSKRNGKPQDGKGYVYKKSSYQYSNSGKNNTSYESQDRNIDQLDELLEDLKNEREHTKDIELVPSSMMYRTLESERNDSPGTYSKTTRVIKTSQVSGMNKVPIEFENNSATDYHTHKSSGYTSRPGTLKNDEYQIKDISYGSTQNIPQNMYESKQKIYKSSNTFENIESKPTTIEHSSTSHLPEDLQNIALSDDILPMPGVKVTTTVRTYTYEIPADSNTDAGQRTLLYKNNNYNTLQRNEPDSNTDVGQRTLLYKTNNYSTLQRNEANHMIRPQPSTVVYNTESYSTIKKGEERPIITNHTKEIRDHVDTTTTYNDYPSPHRNLPDHHHPSGTNKTIIYKVNTTENIHPLPEPMNYRNLPPNTSVPPGGPTTNRYYYHESNVVNTNHGPGSPSSPNGRVSSPQNPPQMGYPIPNDEYNMPKNPPNSSTVHYKYSTTTTNSSHGPDYRPNSHMTQPAPFPVDNRNYPVTNGNPPQRVDDLMQSFGTGDTVDRSDLETSHRKREVETSVASPNQQKIPSVNKAGKEVYYPPGHDMMLVKREEMAMASGSAAGGRWAKGSGMYEYESGYKSKSKTKSGGAVVPVCLPLCCAMPCSIM